MADKSRKLTAVFSYLIMVHIPITLFTWRDMKTRPDGQIRGPKPIWRLVTLLNTSGSVAYWLFGRRRPNRHLLAVK